MKMVHIDWTCYEIWCKKRRCRVLIPEDISQFWVVFYPDADKMWETDMDLFGNRKSLEALRNACAALSEQDDIIVYFPCKRNNHLSLYNYFFRDSNNLKTEPNRYEFTDLVLMKPNSLKISDWKEIRKRISRAKSQKWGYDFQGEFKDMHKKEKYKYRKETPKVMYHFDTVFFNAQSFEYPYLAYSVEEFIAPELEKNLYEDIRSGNQLRGEEGYLWVYCLRDRNNGWYDFETGVFFWDNDIYQQVEKIVPKIKSAQEIWVCLWDR